MGSPALAISAANTAQGSSGRRAGVAIAGVIA
jgi:hypothetical protein